MNNSMTMMEVEAVNNNSGQCTITTNSGVRVRCVYDPEDDGYIWFTDGICVSEHQASKFF